MIREWKAAFCALSILLLTGLTGSVGVALAAPQAGLAITRPSGANNTLAELDEYATTVMGDPWDMAQSTDLDYFYAYESNMAGSSFAIGVYSAQMTAGDGRERITLLTAGAQNHQALRIGKIGYNYPINADHYRYLSFRMYSSNTNCNSGLVQWYADDSYSNQSMGLSQGFLVPPLPCIRQPAGWYTYVVDLKGPLAGGGQPWSGTIRELILHPFAGNGAAGASVKLDWARLTAEDPRTARPYTVSWTGDGSGGPVTLYASGGDRVLDANDIVIAQNQSAAGGSYVFQTGVLPAGTYYIAAVNQGGTAWSSAPLVINAPLQVAITKPSMTSGQDYATTVMGHPWDMSRSSDLNDFVPPPNQTCVTNERYANGIYSAVVPYPVCPANSSGADPILFLGGMNPNPPGTPDPTVDTHKYRYLSYRFTESGTNFSMSRFAWWQVNATDNGVVQNPVLSRDILIVDGWHTYKVDLWAGDLVDESYPAGTRGWQDSSPNRLRLDPNELLASMLPVTIQYDWIKLTAMDEVPRGQPYSIEYDARGDRPLDLTFYYDTDTNPGNGRTSIGSIQVQPRISANSAAGAVATNAIAVSSMQSISWQPSHWQYLPVLYRGPTLDSGRYAWDTRNVPAGTYYICVQSRDGLNTTYSCSEAPVIVR